MDYYEMIVEKASQSALVINTHIARHFITMMAEQSGCHPIQNAVIGMHITYNTIQHYTLLLQKQQQQYIEKFPFNVKANGFATLSYQHPVENENKNGI
jgi:hypothetical protein